MIAPFVCSPHIRPLGAGLAAALAVAACASSDHRRTPMAGLTPRIDRPVAVMDDRPVQVALAEAHPAAPFVLKAPASERERALLCLTQAIYYEAALEPATGQEAVAQTVLNRMRHPAFPKSICGVVYQGASLVTGCQFTFTCNGSRDRAPVAALWRRARAVAERAVGGYVMAAVGQATHYHADYVLPAWAPTLVRIQQFGAQIFYRFPGAAGAPDQFQERYRGGELRVSLAGPPSATAAEPHTLQAVAPPAPEGARIPGQVYFGRRMPTHEEIDRINGVLAAMARAAHTGG